MATTADVSDPSGPGGPSGPDASDRGGPSGAGDFSGRGDVTARGEVPRTLAEPAPRTLSVFDQLGFWGNLGVSLLGFGGAIAVAAPAGLPPLSMPAAAVATITGTVLGAVVLGLSLVAGARTGAPAMVLLRGVLGARASALPTLLNIAQCVGWGTFELVIIAEGLEALLDGRWPRWVCVVLAGAVTTALTVRPLGAIRVLRKYVSVLVVLAVAVLAVGVLRDQAAAPAGSWTSFWVGADAAIAVAVSWVPLGADYARHAHTPRSAFVGGAVGYGVSQIACYLVGLLALARAAQDPDGVFDVFLALPLGVAAFSVLVLREVDQSFANVYSTAVSVQNLRPSWDRLPLTLLIGATTTALALKLDITEFSGFLYLIGGVFVPLSGVLVATWFRRGSAPWDLSSSAPTRPFALLAWAAGFVTYQLINPGIVPGFSDWWADLAGQLHTTGHAWLSASIASFAVAVAVTLLAAAVPRRRP